MHAKIPKAKNRFDIFMASIYQVFCFFLLPNVLFLLSHTEQVVSTSLTAATAGSAMATPPPLRLRALLAVVAAEGSGGLLPGGGWVGAGRLGGGGHPAGHEPEARPGH